MISRNSENPILSLIVPMYNESSNIMPFYDRTLAVLQEIGLSWEMICVNDGSKDDTLLRLADLHRRDPRVKVIDLSRNFGKECALTAGLDYARGQAAIPMDADLQDPPEVLGELVVKWQSGYDVVNAVRVTRDGDTRLKKLTAYLFYRLINKMVRFELPADIGDFRLLSRPVLDALDGLKERRRFMKGIFAWVGFKTTNVYYTREPRYSGKSKWGYWKLWNFAIEGITSFTQVPLQLASYLGLCVSAGAFFYGIYIIFKTLVLGNHVAGYPSMMVVILFLGGVQLVAMGVMGEYIGRIYEESKERPIYLVRQQLGIGGAGPVPMIYPVDLRMMTGTGRDPVVQEVQAGIS